MGVGFIWLPSLPVLAQWFEAKRSFANGLTGAGGGVGGLIFSFSTRSMIYHLGLPWSLRIIDIVSGCVNLLATIMIRSRNKIIKPTQRGFDLKLLRRYDVLLFLGWFFVGLFGYIAILYSLTDFAHSIGLNQDSAAEISGFLSMGTAVGRPLTGLLADRYGRIEVCGLVTFVCGISVFAIWIPDHSFVWAECLFCHFYRVYVGRVLDGKKPCFRRTIVYWRFGDNRSCGCDCGRSGGAAVSVSICWIVAVLPTLCE